MAKTSATEEASKVDIPEEKTSSSVKREFVEYIPPSIAYSERRISKEDWASLGIDGPERVWNRTNNFRILEESFSDQEIAYLEGDGGFRVIEA